jgi:ribonuclease kappa
MVLVSLPKLSAPLPWPRHLFWRNSSELQLINFCSIVLSVFAIVILSVIGALFKSNHHSMMGSTEDPKDGPAVAATVFSAVIVYVVCTFLHYLNSPLAFTLILLRSRLILIPPA